MLTQAPTFMYSKKLKFCVCIRLIKFKRPVCVNIFTMIVVSLLANIFKFINNFDISQSDVPKESKLPNKILGCLNANVQKY